MTEIEKMYENAGIEHGSCKNYRRLECNSPFCNSGMCPYGIGGEKNPFTAAKQLKIIQLLSKIRGDIQLCSDIQYIFVVNFETEKCQWANKYHDKLDEALADMVNVLWQALTDQEKEEIRGILNE